MISDLVTHWRPIMRKGGAVLSATIGKSFERKGKNQGESGNRGNIKKKRRKIERGKKRKASRRIPQQKGKKEKASEG